MDDYVCECDICTGNIDTCSKCGKTMGASGMVDGLCRKCSDEEEEILNQPTANKESSHD